MTVKEAEVIGTLVPEAMPVNKESRKILPPMTNYYGGNSVSTENVDDDGNDKKIKEISLREDYSWLWNICVKYEDDYHSVHGQRSVRKGACEESMGLSSSEYVNEITVHLEYSTTFNDF